MRLKPFFTYFGGKYRAAPRYPPPEYGQIVEPFAGSAGYALRYPERDVTLIDLDPVIAGLWTYLTNVSAKEIRAIPLLSADETVDDLGPVAQEAKWLVGFWLNKGASRPCLRPSAWMRSEIRPNSFWSESIRERIAVQLEHIAHWRVIHGSYKDAPGAVATWFIDPPYERAGKDYKHGAKGIEYADLARWCAQREGQVIVCENEGAAWLPFRSFATIKGMSGSRRTQISKEAIWTS